MGASLGHPSLIKHFHKEHPVWGIWSHPQSWVSQNTGWPQRLKLTSSTGDKEEGPSTPESSLLSLVFKALVFVVQCMFLILLGVLQVK